MKSRFFLIWIFLFSGVVLAQDPTVSGYKLSSGDRIQIHVFGEDDLSMEVTLSDAGTVSYPFLGELEVKGLTAGQLESKIVRGLKGDYLIDPKVNVSVMSYRQFYINGEIEESGGYEYQPGLTLRKAVSVAGGFTERASKKNIMVIREDGESKEPQLIDMDDPVYPGDIITVEQSFF